MRYSIDLRKRVLDFVKNGEEKHKRKPHAPIQETSQEPLIYQWLAAEDPLTWEKPGPRLYRDFSIDPSP